jgi:hypothetical protein
MGYRLARGHTLRFNPATTRPVCVYTHVYSSTISCAYLADNEEGVSNDFGCLGLEAVRQVVVDQRACELQKVHGTQARAHASVMRRSNR